MVKKTICLTMIVKNEGHLIIQCFDHLAKFINFDYWVINDNGSTDGTQTLIKDYFAKKNIPGELDETPWRDFGYNRTIAFQRAYKKTDYAFVWDADDVIHGDFQMPTDLTADHYKFIFGNEMGVRYSRCQLFNNHKRWHYVGVLHEYPACLEPAEEPVDILGNYYFVSGRSGARNKDPEKYLKDAQILEKAFNEAFEKKDPIMNRYCFYTAQSYNSCNQHEKAIEYYKKVLTLNNWFQEMYMSCIEIYDQYDKLNRNVEGLYYLIESFKYDPRRIEGIYRLVKYYCINGPVEAAYAYYTMIAEYYEKTYATENISDYLFAKKEEYDFYLPYYMVIVAHRARKYKKQVKALEIIFRQNYLYSGQWWIHNLFHNIQFAIPHMPKNPEFLESMLKYIENLRSVGVNLTSNNLQVVDRIIAHFRPVLTGPPSINIVKKFGNRPTILLSVTTCKRFDLFEQTMKSVLNMWTDIDKVDYFFCVDDNSSKEDRLKMQTMFPFFHYHMKSSKEKGHRESMNIIWNKLNELRPTYWVHMEDDWVFFKREAYIMRAIMSLEKYTPINVHQVVFNREYGLMMNDMDRVNVRPLGPGIVLHEKKEGVVGPNCAYWPHYSIQPSVCRVEKILELGNYDSAHAFFERDYADKYHAKGYQTAFFDSIYSTHIGKQHWEKDGKNAYALNQVDQLSMAELPNQDNSTTIEVTMRDQNAPLEGTMREHLEAILHKIKTGTPFGIIRPSDGEHSIMINKTLTNCDNWTFTEGGVLRQQLLEAVQTVDPNLYIGIPCNTCNYEWNCTQAIYNDFILNFKVPLAQRTYANIFGNSNWKAFTEFLMAYEPGFFLITSGTEPSEMPIKERFLIDAKLVNDWDSKGVEETERLMRFIADKKGQLICFSAGPLSKVWIPACMKANPTNIYVDVGGSLDLFTKGGSNRFYTQEGHPFSNDACIFRDLTLTNTIPLVIEDSLAQLVSKKYLVYLGVFFNPEYLELLKIFLVTVKLFSSVDQIDFLVLTSEDFQPKIDELSQQIGISLKTHYFSFNSVDEASCARLHIFEYPDATKYEKIMYLDTDITVQGDLMNVFNEPLEEKLYGMKEGTIEHEIHGGWWFDFSTIDKNTVAMNGGILLFRPTETIQQIFSDINAHVKRIKENGEPVPGCADQPFVNYHFIKSGKYNNTLLEKHGLIYCIDPPPPPSEPTDVVICHFVWPIGNAGHKLGRMRPHVSHVLTNYHNIMKPASTKEMNLLVGSSYNWGTYGAIRLESNGVLHTTWQKGTYEWLDNFTLYASWAGIIHFLRFDSTYENFISIRIGDLDITMGSKKMYFINEYGNPVDTFAFESTEQQQAEEYITEDCIVLELGARYGTVSCIINKKLKDPRNQVSVEPDNTVWASLEHNMISNKCNFHLVKGVISNTPLKLVKETFGYANSTVKSENSTIPRFTLTQVESQYNLKFNTLVADCEGFLGQFFEENPHMYKQLTLCIFEKDCPDKCDYDRITNNLRSNGFTNIVSGVHEVWKKV